MSHKDLETAERIGANLTFLFERTQLEIQEISSRSGVGMRTIQAMKSGRGNPNVSNVDAVARAFKVGVTGWHLLSKSLREDFENREFLDRIRDVYGATSKDGQQVLTKALEAVEALPRPQQEAAPPDPKAQPEGRPDWAPVGDFVVQPDNATAVRLRTLRDQAMSGERPTTPAPKRKAK